MKQLRSPGARDMGTARADPTSRETFTVPKMLAVAGIVGPLLFMVGVLVQGVVRTDFRNGYNPLAQTISELTAGPDGWVQQVNFVVFGLLLIALAVGLHQGMRKARLSWLGPALVAWNGVELVIAGLFPLQEDATGRIFDPLGVHNTNGKIFFIGIGIVLVVVSWQFARDERWRSLAAYTLVSGIAVLGMSVLNRMLAVGAQAPLHAWAGLDQRVIVTVWSLCLIVLALRVWRLARTGVRRGGAHV